MTLVPFYILTPRFRFFFFLSFLLRGTLPDLLLRYATPKYREIQRSLLVNVNKDLPGKKVKRKGENKSKRTKRKKKNTRKKHLPRGPFPFPARHPMQSLVLHPPSLNIPQFGQSRFKGPERLPLNRSWSPNARGCSPWAPIPNQSMSGSPPEKPSEPSAEIKPRGYPSSPVVTAERSAVSALELSQGPVNEPRSQFGYNEQGPVYAESPLPGAQPCPLPTLDPTHPTGRPLAQKSTRRTKAHVASACVNCKKKHLGCDPARPCRRCVLAGKAVSVKKYPMNCAIAANECGKKKVNMRGCHAQKARTTPVESRGFVSQVLYHTFG